MDATKIKNVSKGSARLVLTPLIAMAAAFGTVPSARADNNSTSVYSEIRDLAFYSTQDSVLPAWAGYASVAFTQPLEWAIPNRCDQTMVAIRAEDKHLMAAVQAAYASDKPLRVYVDDDQKVSGTPYCILRAVQY